MKTLFLLAALLTVAAPIDPLARYDLSSPSMRRMLFFDAVGAHLVSFRAPARVRALDAAARVEAVKVLGAVAQAYFGSQAFRDAYATYRNQTLGPPPAPLRNTQALIAERRADLSRQFAQAEATAQQMAPAQRAPFEKALAEAQTAWETQLANPGDLAQLEQERFEAETAAYQRKLAELPAAPDALIAHALGRFLQGTSDIAFDARLVERDGVKRFARPAYEAKPKLWKAGFRAGRAPTNAARVIAKDWQRALRRAGK